jgi:hypothetical protein
MTSLSDLAMEANGATASYDEDLMTLGVLLQGATDEFVGRIRRLLVEERYKFASVELRLPPTMRADEPWPAFVKSTKLMAALLSAAEKRDENKLAIVEHQASLPFDRENWG